MRFLYGDLSEFPLKENVLALLSDFIDAAVPALDLHHKIEGLLESIESDRSFLSESFQEIDHLQKTLKGVFREVVESRSAEDVVSIMASGAAEQVNKFLDDGKGKLEAKVEERIARTQEEIRSLKQDIMSELAKFFLVHSFPVGSKASRCSLAHGNYEGRSEILDLNGIKLGYSLDTGASEFFSKPRKFSELISGRTDLPVQTKKGWLKKEPVVQSVRLDDMFVFEIIDDDVGTAIRIRPKIEDEKGGLLIRIKKADVPSFELLRVDEDAGEIPVSKDLLNSEHVEVLMMFWKEILSRLEDLYGKKKDLLWVKLGGEKLLDSGQTPELVRRIVEYLAPTIREIDARSPAMEELCLKLEREDGKREEFYLQKEKLVESIGSLPEELASIFLPLGLALEIEEEEQGGDIQEVSQPPDPGETVNSEVQPILIGSNLVDEEDEEELQAQVDSDSEYSDELDEEPDDFEIDVDLSEEDISSKENEGSGGEQD
ncbi:MAG: hypothetical protein GXP49_02760 [Deltaproteobacteria bacterium]|nr:hypothetical protein [Deltaproteobacteria bacterium]